ncbi:NACHT domain-containing protein [Kocuria sp. M1N1S27]|uniref:NACHT domain-containing protein n=1 Tax=Kocuria kalidii TaxID=3376283 RepID=UPI00378A8850
MALQVVRDSWTSRWVIACSTGRVSGKRQALVARSPFVAGLRSFEVQQWLFEEWRTSNSRICLIEGFSGIGKTTLAHNVAKSWSLNSVVVSVEKSPNILDDLLFEVAALLEEQGCKTIADADEGDFRTGLLAHIADENLVVLDHFESILDSNAHTLDSEFINYLKRIEKTPGAGKIILLSSEQLDVQDQLPHIQKVRMSPFSTDEAETFLADLLRRSAHEDSVPTSQLGEVVEWLGCNALAIRAFVACLDSYEFAELLDEEPETWALRHQPATQGLITKLQVAFLEKTIKKLSPEAKSLLETTSVLRKPFKVDALRYMTNGIANVESARAELSRLFILEKPRGLLNLNSVARHLAYANLKSNPKQLKRSHSLAGEFFRKRAGQAPGGRGIVIAGKAFVEARHHFRLSDRLDEVENLAGDFRRFIASNYANATNLPSSPDELNEYIVIIRAVLSSESGGYHALRQKFAEALLVRGQVGDRVLALRNLTIATEKSKLLRAWVTRVNLTAEMDSTLARHRVFEEAFERLPAGDAAIIAVRTAEQFMQSGLENEAVIVLDKALRVIPKEQTQRLFTARSYVRLQSGQPNEAIKGLLDGYSTLSLYPKRAYKLFEEGVFISLQQRDTESLAKFRNFVNEHGLNEHQGALVNMLICQCRGDYSGAIRIAESHEQYPSVVFQLAFSQLCNGNANGAAKTLAKYDASIPSNDVKCWLNFIVSLCNNDDAKTAQVLANWQLDASLVEEEELDIIALKIWDKIPRKLQPYPAFYFPVLPSVLTGLEYDLVRTGTEGSALDFVDTAQFRFIRQQASAGIPSNDPAHATPLVSPNPSFAVYIQNKGTENNLMGDTYNVRNAGAVGKKAFNAGDAIYKPNQEQTTLVDPHVLEDLKKIIQVLQSDGQANANQMSLLYGAVDSIENGDEAGVRDRLVEGGKWLANQSATVGTGLLTVVLQNVFGIQA